MRCRSALVVAVVSWASYMPLALAQNTSSKATDHKQDEQAVRAAGKEYIAALERGDVKAMAAFWTPDGDFVDEAGRSHPAKDVIEQEGKAAGKGPRPDTKVTGESIRFLTADVAIEDGTSEVIHAKGLPSVSGRFMAIWVKRDGKWRLASLRELRIEPASAAVQLTDLDAFVGDWSATSDDTSVAVSANWNVTRTFLLRDLKVAQKGMIIFNATQRIGWDPLTHKIKSWTFDSDGGYGEGIWTKEGNAWLVQATGVLPDGRRTSSTNIYSIEGKDSFTWKSIGARTNGESQPEMNVKLLRKKAAK
jgi:uncharacterized protein (TIGR02246 family)